MPVASIYVNVTNDGQANVSYPGLSPLAAANILAQIVVQLQAQAMQQAGQPVIVAPGAVRLS